MKMRLAVGAWNTETDYYTTNFGGEGWNAKSWINVTNIPEEGQDSSSCWAQVKWRKKSRKIKGVKVKVKWCNSEEHKQCFKEFYILQKQCGIIQEMKFKQSSVSESNQLISCTKVSCEEQIKENLSRTLKSLWSHKKLTQSCLKGKW
jgi:hypothetical protein